MSILERPLINGYLHLGFATNEGQEDALDVHMSKGFDLLSFCLKGQSNAVKI